MNKERMTSKKRFKFRIKKNDTSEFIDSKEVLLPPLNIKLDLMKQFKKALYKTWECFQYFSGSFQHL